MSIDTHTLIWLFPIAFMFHDFEEIILGEPWLRKNAGEIKARIKNRVPAVISSVLFVISYGLILYWRLIKEGMVNMSGLLTYFLLAVALTIPFILVMHIVGDYLYKKTVRLLIDQVSD